MTAPLTDGRGEHYRSHVGTDNVPMGLDQGLTGHRRPNRAASHSERGFSMAGRVDYPARGSRFSYGRFFAESARPATKASAKCPGGRSYRLHRSLAMVKSRSCRRAHTGAP
jgi:hypothetical protein